MHSLKLWSEISTNLRFRLFVLDRTDVAALHSYQGEEFRAPTDRGGTFVNHYPFFPSSAAIPSINFPRLNHSLPYLRSRNDDQSHPHPLYANQVLPFSNLARSPNVVALQFPQTEPTVSFSIPTTNHLPNQTRQSRATFGQSPHLPSRKIRQNGIESRSQSLPFGIRSQESSRTKQSDVWQNYSERRRIPSSRPRKTRQN